MARYLARILNGKGYRPSDARSIAREIREALGSSEAIGNLRVSSRAVEFDLFAEDLHQLESRESALEKQFGRILTMKSLDQPTTQRQDKMEVLTEGVQLFNEERFWESHEALERIWHPAKGLERDVIQGMILTAAALVHAQKDRNETSLTMLQKARDKLGTTEEYEGIDLVKVRQSITRILSTQRPEPFKIDLQRGN